MIIHCKIKFNSLAKDILKFPITNNMRLSIWPDLSEWPDNRFISMPSEFQITNPIDIDQEYIIPIFIAKWNGVEKYFTKNARFKLGTPDAPYAEGIVLEEG